MLGGPNLGELNASAQGRGGELRPRLKLGVTLQTGDQFVAKQAFLSLFRNSINGVLFF